MTFPIDYNAFIVEWYDWRERHAAALKRSSYRWHAPNFLADEVLWRGAIGSRQVELSAVTMPAFGERPRRDLRFIGITFAEASGTWTPENPIVETWAELEAELGL